MESIQRALLRLHIEAVWGVTLPSIDQSHVELLREGFQPSWRLYSADMADGRVVIWRPDVSVRERDALLARAHEALALPPAVQMPPEISREVVLQQVTAPTISIAAAQKIACQLTPQDRALVEAFEPDDNYFHPAMRPLFGVIIEGRLLSLARSARRTAAACELGIDTLPEARRKGYALAATLLWAASVTQEGLAPLYSASADNTASISLATAAGYRVFAHAVTIGE